MNKIDNGYLIKCKYDYVLKELKEHNINWYNFNTGDTYYTDNCDEYLVTADHLKKEIRLELIVMY